MKKIALGFVLILLGMGIVTASSFAAFALEGDNSEDDETNSGEEGIMPLSDNLEGKSEIPGKNKKIVIDATIEINPGKLNCKSNGKWITAYIGLPSSYYVGEIDIDSIILKTSSDELYSNDEFPYEIINIYGDSNPELMIKFDRSDLILILEPEQFNEISITGKLDDKVTFKWGGVIELIHY